MISGQSIGIAQPFSMAPGEQLDFELDFTDELLADLDTLQDATCSASNALSYHDLRIVGNTVYVWVTVATDAPINSVARLKLFATSSSFPTRIRCISIDFAIEYGGRQG